MDGAAVRDPEGNGNIGGLTVVLVPLLSLRELITRAIGKPNVGIAPLLGKVTGPQRCWTTTQLVKTGHAISRGAICLSRTNQSSTENGCSNECGSDHL